MWLAQVEPITYTKQKQVYAMVIGRFFCDLKDLKILCDYILQNCNQNVTLF